MHGVLKQTVAVHSGDFHADDVFCVATLQLLLGNDAVSVVRTRDEDVLATADWVCDVGGVYDHARRRYDHHQVGAPVRDNGIPYAAFGLVWKHHGANVAGDADVANIIDETLVQHIDATDNGSHSFRAVPEHDTLMPVTIDTLVKQFRPSDPSDRIIRAGLSNNAARDASHMDARFLEATTFARGILERTIAHVRAELPIRAHVAEVIASYRDGVPVFEHSVPVELFPTDAAFRVVVMPYDASTGSWKAQCLRKRPYEFPSRAYFPRTWAGLRDEALQRESGVSDALFCHGSRTSAFAASREGALALAAHATPNA